MRHEHYSQSLEARASRVVPGPTTGRRGARPLLCLAAGVILALLLTCLEGVLWIVNPGHLFGPLSHTLAGFFALPLHAPVLLLVPLLEIVCGFSLVWVLTPPLAVLAYLWAIRKAQSVYHARATPLQAGSYPYDTPIFYTSDSPHTVQPRSLKMLEFIDTMMATDAAHLLLLGASGAGKTMLLHEYLAAVAQQRVRAAFGKLKLPILLPLRYYALHFQTLAQADAAHLTFLDLMVSCDLPGLHHLHPYLDKLFRQGRLFLLCDGLDEVPEDARPALDGQLIALMRQQGNRLLLTSTPHVYEQSPNLVQAIGENKVRRAVLQSLEQADRRGIIERFLTEMDARYRPNLPTTGQVMQLIESTRLRFFLTTPLTLFTLLELLEIHTLEELRELDTRGRLLHAYLRKCREVPARASTLLPEDLLFLRQLACLARWNGENTLLCLPAESVRALHPARHHTDDEQVLAQVMGSWSSQQQVHFPFVEESAVVLSESLPAERIKDVLHRAYRIGLIDLTAQGVLEFRHPLLASALLAEYLASVLGAAVLHVEEIETLPAHFALWSEPFALWAGLLDYPLETAGALGRWATDHPEQQVNALLASLICLGVAQRPPGTHHRQTLTVPPELEAAFRAVVQDAPALADLATLFQRCAIQDVPELYQALFPLLTSEGSEVFLKALDPAQLSERFFLRLVDVIDDVEQEQLVKLLVRALGNWGSAVVPRATLLAAASFGAGGRLRTAAINVLGGTHDSGAVEPLLGYLRDTDPIIASRAANALVRLGPELTLQHLLAELAEHTAANTPLPGMLLPIIERFLNESEPTRRLQPAQFERVIDALLSLVAHSTVPPEREKAREMLVSQGRLAEERASGKIALRLLVQNLATTDETLARTMSGTLIEVGQVATPRLLEQLAGSPSEAERVRILDVLARLQDTRALPNLLHLLADNSPVVQHTLATTLAAYAPACLPGLIDTTLYAESELVATRAEQILGNLGTLAVEPVLQALTPLVAGRTLLLVHVLERVRDPRVIPALIALLDEAQSDAALTLALIQALGQFTDRRVVLPLLNLLTSTNPLLYEGAINALSSLGELALPDLLARLTGPDKTPLIARIERVLLGMQPFPGGPLLAALNDDDEHRACYIEEVFLARGSDAAHVAATNLFHPQPRIRARVRQALGRMNGRYAVPALLEVLNRPEPAWRALLAELLLAHLQEAIPPLVGLLDDPERGEAATSILFQAGRPVLPALVPALDATSSVRGARARSVLVTLVQRQHELLTDVVQLFSLALPARAREALKTILVEDLAAFSLPALLSGLEDAHLVADVSATLVRLADRSSAQCAHVLDELLLALREETRRYGASLTLIELGPPAVPSVGALITDPDPHLAHSSRQILGEIGPAAFPFLWAAHSDASNPARREAARDIFRAMPTGVIADELVTLLSSARQEEISMALALLLERIHDEAHEPGYGSEMIAALLEHVQFASDERASLRILALLLLLGGPTVAQALLDALATNPQRHTQLAQSLLLLGQEVEAELWTLLQDADTPAQLQAEVAGVLAMRAPSQEIQAYALSLSEHGLWAGRSAHHVTTVLQPSQLDIALRTLGGLLVAGHWDSLEVQDLRAASKVGSAERELYETLLGWRYSPHITRLEHELDQERTERKRELLAHTQELLTMKAQLVDLEQEMDGLKREHAEQQRGHEEKHSELQASITQLTKEKQTLQADLQQSTRERQTFVAKAQQATQEQARLQAEAERWQEYSQQLEQELTVLRRPRSNA